jgi:hypothetical protein
MPTMEIKEGIKIYLIDKNREYNREIRKQKRRLHDYKEELAILLSLSEKDESDLSRIEDLKSYVVSQNDIIKQMSEKVVEKKELIERIELLKKSKYLIAIDPCKNKFVIYTKSLKTKGKKIGSFEIRIPYKGYDIKIFNTNKSSSGLQHWFVNENGQPCFGEWREGIRESLGIGDLDIVIINIVEFLMSTYKSFKGWTDFNNFSESIQ